MRAYRFRMYPNKTQVTLLSKHLTISATLWNLLLSKTKEKYQKEKRFFSKTDLQAMVKGSPLYSQAAQNVSHRLYDAIQKKISAKRSGMKCGFPRFKNIDRAKSLHYPQFGFFLKEKLKVSPFGEIALVKHRQVQGNIKTLTLKREASGRWFAILCTDFSPPAKQAKTNAAAGVDMGLSHFATLSDGRTIPNPRHIKKVEKKLAFLSRVFSKKKKGSKNRERARIALCRCHEKLANRRHDFLHKEANSLLSSYSFLALESLNIRVLSGKKFGKWINDAAWGAFANILAYKAESAGCNVVFVDAKGTSQECSSCGAVVKKELWQRKHLCNFCRLEIDRDLNASINILNRATAGIAGSNACGDGIAIPSTKQEARLFIGG